MGQALRRGAHLRGACGCADVLARRTGSRRCSSADLAQGAPPGSQEQARVKVRCLPEADRGVALYARKSPPRAVTPRSRLSWTWLTPSCDPDSWCPSSGHAANSASSLGEPSTALAE